jgi:hypothetical protein
MAKSWKTKAAKLGGEILANWPLKITALGLAAILWAAVAGREPTTQLIAVRLEVEPPEGRTRTGELPQVQALYWGTARELIKLYGQPPIIRKALPDTITGSDYTLQLSLGDLVTADGAAVSAQRLEPHEITIHLDDVVQRSVRVVEQVTDSPDTGFQILSVSVTPRQVTIRGPEAQVEAVDSVLTEPLSLARVREPVRRSIPIDTTGLGAVRPFPSEVEIAIDVGALSERVLMGVPVTIRADQPGPWISEPPAVIVTVRGRTTRLAELTRDSVRVYATLSDGGADSVVALQVDSPVNVTAWTIPDSVIIRRGSND